MQSKINELIKRFESLRKDLEKEYNRLRIDYGYTIEKRRIVFLKEFTQRNGRFKEGVLRMIFNASVRNVLSAPFIYMMIIPAAVILDIFLVVYQYTAFFLYRIPRVKRSDHFVYERHFLDYLNWVEKINCLYCSYVNGIFSYAMEIGACTERYWCPLKATRHPKFPHTWYNDFADYGNPEEWIEKYSENDQAFCKIKNKEE